MGEDAVRIVPFSHCMTLEREAEKRGQEPSDAGDAN